MDRSSSLCRGPKKRPRTNFRPAGIHATVSLCEGIPNGKVMSRARRATRRQWGLVRFALVSYRGKERILLPRPDYVAATRGYCASSMKPDKARSGVVGRRGLPNPTEFGSD